MEERGRLRREAALARKAERAGKEQCADPDKQAE